MVQRQTCSANARELKGFVKLSLQPGETKTATFTLDKRAFAYWNTRIHDWHVESGDFVIEIGQSSAHIVASVQVTVESTVKLPQHFTMDSIFLDLMKDERARQMLVPLMAAVNESFGISTAEDSRSEVAASAITPAMLEAMVRYSPLRSLLSFAPGKVTYEQLVEMVDALNRG